MRVAYLINQYPKTSHSFIRREIQALEARGVAIDRYALRGWDEPLVDPADREERISTRYVLQGGAGGLVAAMLSAALRTPGRFLAMLRMAWRMSRPSERSRMVHLAYAAEACVLVGWMRRTQANHLHAHFGTNPADVAVLARALGGPPCSFTVHGPEEFDHPKALNLAFKIKHSAFVVAISSYGRSQLFRWLDVEHWSRVKIIHCGLDRVFHGSDLAPMRDTPKLVCVGRLCEQKGQLLLVQAVRQLLDRGIAVQLTLAGDGDLRQQIEALVIELGLTAAVRITGWIDGSQVRAEVLSSRALVLPSFAEGLPVVLMEAMALGRPVISTYVAGIPELVIDQVNGWLVPAGDVDALADVMAHCLQEPIERLAKMGSLGRQRVLERHSVETETSKLLQYIEASGLPGVPN